MALEHDSKHKDKILYYQSIERMVAEAKSIGNKLGQIVDVCVFFF
jgi:hypothetical protein